MDGTDKNLQRKLKKFRQQGWSETKISRWLAQQDDNNEKKARQDAQYQTAATPEVTSWLSFIQALLESQHTSAVGLLLHWYHAGTNTERITIKYRVQVQRQELSIDVLFRLEEDVLYIFHA
jgi:hypothetical protein